MVDVVESEPLTFGEHLRPGLTELLGAGRSAGADLVEFFLEGRRHLSVEVQDGRPVSVEPFVGVGAGVRVLRGTSAAYVSTNDISFGGLRLALERALAIAGLSIPGAGRLCPHVHLGLLNDYARSGGKEQWLGQLPSAKDLVGGLSGACLEMHRRLPHRQSTTASSRREWQEILVAASDGTFVRDIRLNDYLRLGGLCVDGAHRTEVGRTEGGTSRPEFALELDHRPMIDELVEAAGHSLRADFVESGRYPVVMGNRFGGVIFHEACGHLLETTQIQRGTTPFAGRRGEPIAHPAVTAWDEGIWPGAYGSIDVDDEGFPVQKTLLIEGGVLRNYMADRMGHLRCGVPRTGSGRRQSFAFAPGSRMRNTYLGAGEYTPQQLFDSVDRGIYCKQLGGGSVNSTGEFNFAVQEAWLIENGRLTRPLKGATIVGTAQDILMKISMCANDLDVSPGHCGSVSGRIFTTVGQPHVRVDQVTIGGR